MAMIQPTLRLRIPAIFIFFGILIHGALAFCAAGYNDFGKSQKDIIFFDDFNNNDNDWSVGDFGDGRRIGKIKNGYYHWESTPINSEAGTSHLSVPIDESRDFEIEAKIRFVKGKKSSLNALLWGLKKKPYADYAFGFNGNQEFDISKYKNEYTKFAKWQSSSFLNRTQYNKLTIRKVKRTFYFFINERLVHSMPAKPFFGDRLGFQAAEKSIINVDYLQVAYLDKKGETIARNQSQAGSKSRYHEIASSQKTLIFSDDFADNKNDWPVGTFGDGHRVGKIENGYYHWESTPQNDQAGTSHITIDVDQSKDFEIESKIRFVKGKQSSLNALLWGLKKKPYADYAFGFNGNQEFDISKYQKEYTKFVQWRSSTYLNRDGYNKLTIRKLKGTFYFFINEYLVHSMPFAPFFGDRFGFQAAEKTVINVDYLKVAYLEPRKKTPPANRPPAIEIIAPMITAGTTTVKEKKLKVAGKVTDPDGIYEVVVNGVDASLQSNGYFSVSLPLAVGDNKISVRATDIKMKSAVRTFSAHRQAAGSGPVTIVQNAPQIQSPGGKRLALVIGNADYTYGRNLANPVNDARSIEGALKNLGFGVLKYENTTQKQMKKAIDLFGRRLKNYDIALFFFAGHGVQVNGSNYLIPTDARLEDENDVEYDTVRADRVLAKMESAGSKTNIVVLDACRDNPFERSWNRSSKGTGLAFMNAPSGSIIAYATSPGRTASDGTGSNGLYTSAILKHIHTPNITIEQMFKRVRTTIMEVSGNEQVPWESTSLRGDFYFSNR